MSCQVSLSEPLTRIYLSYQGAPTGTHTPRQPLISTVRYPWAISTKSQVSSASVYLIFPVAAASFSCDTIPLSVPRSNDGLA